MAADVAMNDMDIDFDMDPEIARLQAEAEAINARAEAADTEAMNGVEEAPEEGEVDHHAPALTKVHVRGVDNLNTFDIEDWAGEHYSRDLLKKVQWIDDTSANLIYDTETAAAEALAALSAEDEAGPLQLRLAKKFSSRPELELQVRQAIVADVKAPRAKDRSRYYLLNKEWDPDNPDNIRPDNRKRRWNDDDRRDNKKYRRRDYGRRSESKEGQQFHESMYDDDPKPAEELRRRSHSSGSEYGRRRGKPDGDVLANRATGRLRDRSASPGREGDGRFGFDEVHPRRQTARARSVTPPGVRAGKDNMGARDNLRKELFPDKRASTALANSHTNGAPPDLFSTRPTSSSSSRELFPDKVNGAGHRRNTAKSLTPSEVADAIGKYTIGDSVRDASAYSSSGRRADTGNGGESRDLFSRINGGPKIDSTLGRLHDRPAADKDHAGFSFKGAGRRQEEGFSILGASRERVESPLVKELFPLKANNNDRDERDLFDGRIKGRGAQRRRAEDLF